MVPATQEKIVYMETPRDNEKEVVRYQIYTMIAFENLFHRYIFLKMSDVISKNSTSVT